MSPDQNRHLNRRREFLTVINQAQQGLEVNPEYRDRVPPREGKRPPIYKKYIKRKKEEFYSAFNSKPYAARVITVKKDAADLLTVLTACCEGSK